MRLVPAALTSRLGYCFALGATLVLLQAGCSKSNTVNASGECSVDDECIDDGNPCTREQCDEGTCKHPLAADQATCPGGACWNGECCQGCYNGTVCKTGTEFAECGRGGVTCETCDDANECTVDACTAQGCGHDSEQTEATKCNAGTCRAGSCCQGCWDGAACRAGTSDAAACGVQGTTCSSCDDTNACTVDSCVAGACTWTAAADQAPCPDGRCWGSQCCTGCYDGTTCMTGDQVQACGAAGATCLSCDDGKECTTDACIAGACANADDDGATCSSGVCEAGACVCGAAGQPCCGAGACNAAELACASNHCTHCGDNGDPCCVQGDACHDAGSGCILGQCTSCGGANQPCCPSGTACADNQLACVGGQCLHCGLGLEACCAGDTCASADLSCVAATCVQCGGASEPCCGGSNCGTGLACISGACTPCGGQNQPCCGGTQCSSPSLLCNASQTCEHCGLPSEPCCSGSACTGSAVLCTSGTCRHCGDSTEPCCPGSLCSDPASLVCAANACVACGGQNQPCCDAAPACTASSTVCASGTCARCGGAGQPCCSASTCDAWLACSNTTQCEGCGAQLSVGTRATCVLRRDGKVYCFGLNSDGILGTTLVTSSNVGLPISLSGTPTALSVGLTHACAILGDGTVWCWGSDMGGAIGPNTTEAVNPIPVYVPLPSAALQISVSQYAENATCAVLDTHEVYCWGNGTSGWVLGMGTTGVYVDPVLHPQLGADNAEVVLGYTAGCARKLNGSLYCWGSNQNGQVGNGSVGAQATPVQVALLGTSVSSVSVGENVTCARHASGSIWCWGIGDLVGDGSTTSTPKPSPNELVSLGNDNASVDAGMRAVCVRKTNGTLHCWGSFDYSHTYNAPQAADADLAPSLHVGCGNQHCCSLVDDGRVWCIGRDSEDGSMGAPPTPPYSSTVTNLTTAVIGRFSCQ